MVHRTVGAKPTYSRYSVVHPGAFGTLGRGGEGGFGHILFARMGRHEHLLLGPLFPIRVAYRIIFRSCIKRKDLPRGVTHGLNVESPRQPDGRP